MIHGFHPYCGTGTSYLKAQLIQKLTTISEEVLYKIFPDKHKLYGALDRDRCLEILEGYVVVPRDFRLLITY